jgi:hypothetical protein
MEAKPLYQSKKEEVQILKTDTFNKKTDVFHLQGGILAPRKSIKVTVNPCWKSSFLGFNYDCCLGFLSIRINSCL